MRIQSIEAIPVRYPEPNDHNAQRHLCLVRIGADDGRVGWGEAVTMWPEASQATKAIVEGLSAVGKSVIVLSGQLKARQRRQISEQLANHIADAEPLLVVGTGSFIGEGFDCPALDTLFLAAPITFKNRLVQYVGRITRPHPDKTTATVHDYHDELTPVIASSLRKRAPGYTKMGFPDPRTLVR